MNIYYHPLYTKGIDSKSTFPKERYDLIKEQLVVSELSNIITIKTPTEIETEDIYRAHAKEYVDAFLNSDLSEKQVREIGLKPWTNKIIQRTLLLTGGSLCALDDIYNGAAVAANMAGGTHHAFRDRGSGFCIFNDLAICANYCLRNFTDFKNILIVDLDVHQGDGTAALLKNEDSVYTFSMHCESNFPLKKQQSDLDIALRRDMGDQTYIRKLASALEKLEEKKN